jgi:hypothetical protein
MTFEAGPIAEAKKNDVLKPFQRFVDQIRLDFGKRGFLIEDSEARKLWTEYFLPKYMKGE